MEKIGVDVADSIKHRADRILGDIQIASAAPPGTERDEMVKDEPEVALPPLVVYAIDDGETLLATLVYKAQVDWRSPELAHGVTECHFFRCHLQNRGAFVNDSFRGNGRWAYRCSQCFDWLGTGTG